MNLLTRSKLISVIHTIGNSPHFPATRIQIHLKGVDMNDTRKIRIINHVSNLFPLLKEKAYSMNSDIRLL